MRNAYTTGKKDKQESQTIEWKWSWQDEYLKWLCGYANTEGGTLHIGVNDDGYVVGIKDSKETLESLPNKVRDKLGIWFRRRINGMKPSANSKKKIRFGNQIEMRWSIWRFLCRLIHSQSPVLANTINDQGQPCRS